MGESTQVVVGVACSHQRLAWIHPFIDGNGRVARLHSHLVFHSMGLSKGLWSPMRGLARTQEQYYARLNNADLPRRNDLDGRGLLSQEELVAFARYFLDICLDQVRFMCERSCCICNKRRGKSAAKNRWSRSKRWKHFTTSPWPDRLSGRVLLR